MTEEQQGAGTGPELTGEDDLLHATVRAETAALSVRSIMFGYGPRFARDAFGPLLLFYLVWKLWALVPAVLAATALSVFSWWWERRNERPGIMARIGLALVVVYAVVGIIADDAKVYLAQPVLVSGIYGVSFLVSVALGKPLAGFFAREVYPFPDELKASQTWRTVFGRISIVWGLFLLARSSARMLILVKTNVDLFVAINFVTGAPLIAGVMSWSVWYGLRGFRASEEWGWAFGTSD